MKTQPLIMERTYRAPIEKVWKAITDRDQMKQWYFEFEEFKPEKGFKGQFRGGDDCVEFLHEIEILECDPPHKLSYSWVYTDYEGYSMLTWELFKEAENKTRLKLTHDGLESFPQDNPNFKRESFNGGWTYFVNEALPKFVEVDVIRKSISISAAGEVIWDILLNPTNQWADAFGEGSIAKTDWKLGSDVIWTDGSGDVGAYGVVRAHRPLEYLQIDMYDDTNPAPGAETGEYNEKYRLSSSTEENKMMLSIESGPLTEKLVQEHGVLWDRALEIIKALAEKR